MGKKTLIDRACIAADRFMYTRGTDAYWAFRIGWMNGCAAGKREAARRAKPARKGVKK